jgi:hypothetical protein
MRRAALIPLSAALLALAVAGGPAQPVSGDLVLVDARSTTLGMVFRRDSMGALSTLYAGFPGYFPNWISMAADNSAVLVPFADGQSFDDGFITRVSSTGVLSVLKTIGNDIGFSNGHEPDGSGSVINAGQFGVLFRLDPVLLILTVLAKVPPTLNEVAVNRDDGSYLGVVFPFTGPTFPGSLLRFDPATAGLTTLIQADPRISRPSGLVHDPATGDYLVSRFDAPGVVRVNPITLAVATLWAQPLVNAIAPTPRNTWLVATETDAREIDGNGAVIRTITFPTLLRIMGIAEYGDRRIATFGEALPGRSVRVDVNTARSGDANRVYVLAASLATRPDALGPLPTGEVLNLAADTLFFATAANALPAIFSGFLGTLDSQSHAQAAVNIPAAVPAGLNLPVHIGGIVLDGGAPGGVSTVLPSVTIVLR